VLREDVDGQDDPALAIAVAVLGLISGVICVTYMVDVRDAFNDPANLADANFSPGVGLVAACALSFALLARGDNRVRHRMASYVQDGAGLTDPARNPK
jgi:hypothetical protein